MKLVPWQLINSWQAVAEAKTFDIETDSFGKLFSRSSLDSRSQKSALIVSLPCLTFKLFKIPTLFSKSVFSARKNRGKN
jgi:hypothetical protein